MKLWRCREKKNYSSVFQPTVRSRYRLRCFGQDFMSGIYYIMTDRNENSIAVFSAKCRNKFYPNLLSTKKMCGENMEMSSLSRIYSVYSFTENHLWTRLVTALSNLRNVCHILMKYFSSDPNSMKVMMKHKPTKLVTKAAHVWFLPVTAICTV